MAEQEALREQEVKDRHDSDATGGGDGERKKEEAETPSGDVDQKVQATKDGGDQFDPVSRLNEDQKEALEKMRTKMNKYTTTDEEKQYCNDMCLLRYLRARDYNVHKARKVLL